MILTFDSKHNSLSLQPPYIMATPNEDEQRTRDAELIKRHEEVTQLNEERAQEMKEMETTKSLAAIKQRSEIMKERIDAIEEELFGRKLPPGDMAELCRQIEEDEHQVPDTERIKRHEELAREIAEIEARLEVIKKDLADRKLRREAEEAVKEANEIELFGRKLPPGVMEELYKQMEKEGY
jgi:hypothetical protein